MSMSKKNMISACDTAMSSTDAANTANTNESHSDAASKHRIAAEHCKLMGEDAMHTKHKDMAVEHDLCAGRCAAADSGTNKVKVPEPSAEEVKARSQMQASNPQGINQYTYSSESSNGSKTSHSDEDEAETHWTNKHKGAEFGDWENAGENRERKLVWRNSEEAENDDGTNAVGQIIRKSAKVSARSGCPEQAEDEDKNVKCEKCGKEFDAAKEDGHETGEVNCPGCDYKVKVASSYVPAQAAAAGGKKGSLEAAWSDEAREAAALARKSASSQAAIKATKAASAGPSTDTDSSPEDQKTSHDLHIAAAEAHHTAANDKENKPSVRKEHFASAINQEAMAFHSGHKGATKFKFDSSQAYLATANKLSAKRMVSKQPLMAALAGAGWSLNDMQTGVGALLKDLDVCHSDSETACSPYCWCCDIVAPDNEEGEEWTAVFNGADGKLYAVTFKVGEEVELVGDPEEVQKTTDYEYAADIAAKAAAAAGALEATWSNAAREAAELARKHGATDFDKKHAEALKFKSIADSSEARANKSGLTKDIHDALSAHTSAIMVHHEAANAAKAEGNMPAYHAHMDMAAQHEKQRNSQYKKLASQAAHEASRANTEQPLCAKVRSCHDALVAGGANPTLKAVASAVWREHKVSLGEDDVARELGASKALEASNPEGHNQYTEANQASEATNEKAKKASDKAKLSGSIKDHRAAADAHYAAAKAHSLASEEANKAGLFNADNQHAHEANIHFQKAMGHNEDADNAKK